MFFLGHLKIFVKALGMTNTDMEKVFVRIGVGYGGAVKVRATIDEVDFMIEKEEAQRILEWVIRDGRLMKAQTKRMIYPRLKLIEQQ